MNEENTDLEKELEDVISRSKAQKAKETEDLIKKNYEQKVTIHKRATVHNKGSAEYYELRDINDSLRLTNHYLWFIKLFIILFFIIPSFLGTVIYFLISR